MTVSIRSSIAAFAFSCVAYTSSLAFDIGDALLTLPGFLIISNYSGRDIQVDTSLDNYTIRTGQVMHVKIEESFNVNHLELGTAGGIKDALSVAGKKLFRCNTLGIDSFEKDLQSVTFDKSTYGYLSMIATNATPEGVACGLQAISRDTLEDLFDDD